MGFFDEFLKTKVAAEDQAVLAKYPELKSSVERMETHNAQWNEWQARYWDPAANMTKREVELEESLAAATAAGASQSTLATIQADFEKKLQASQTASLQAIEGMNLFYGATAKRMLPHQQEFSENLDPQSLMKYMQDNRIQDPDIAYDRMVAGKRAEIAAQRDKDLEAKHAADIAAAEQRGRELAAREVAMGPNGVMPTDGSGGIAGVTSRIDKPVEMSDAARAAIAAAKPGSGELAALGYQQYLRGELPL